MERLDNIVKSSFFAPLYTFEFAIFQSIHDSEGDTDLTKR